MFGLFKKRSALDKLHDKYQSLMKEAKQLSTSNRAAADERYAEADKVLKEIEVLETKS